MSTNNDKYQQRGRPPVEIDWPDVVFTAQDVVDTFPKKVSRVTIHSKLNKAVDNGSLDVVGVTKSANGRPRVKYKKSINSNHQEGVVVSENDTQQQQTYLG